MDSSPIRQETPSSGQTVPIKGHYWATPTNRELQNAPQCCEEVWSYNSVCPQLARPPQCIRGAVRSALIGHQAQYCPLIGCQGQESWLQLSNITRWCQDRVLARPLYIYSDTDRQIIAISPGQEVTSETICHHNTSQSEACAHCYWPMRRPCRNVSNAMISFRWQKLDNNEWAVSVQMSLCDLWLTATWWRQRSAKTDDISFVKLFLFLCHKRLRLLYKVYLWLEVNK